MRFVDQAQVKIRSGGGGHGCLSFRREKFIEFGGPNGGDGGDGGDVVALATAGLNTLVDYRYRRQFRAANGRPGMGSERTGARGGDVVLQVPVGTQILDAETGLLLADLTAEGERVVLLQGGRGGRGNAAFKSATNRAPRRADPGQPGDERNIVLRLKLLADAGLIGLPNAGKSTFLAAVSRARPKVADYPFTTLYPQLGVVAIDGREFVLADIPGLIEGAHRGAGLGIRFLGHVERCQVLLHLVDATAEDVAAAYRTVRQELALYGAGLAEKQEIVVLNKADAIDQATAAERRRALAAASGRPVSLAAGATGEGVRDVLLQVRAILDAAAAAEPAAAFVP